MFLYAFAYICLIKSSVWAVHSDWPLRRECILSATSAEFKNCQYFLYWTTYTLTVKSFCLPSAHDMVPKPEACSLWQKKRQKTVILQLEIGAHLVPSQSKTSSLLLSQRNGVRVHSYSANTANVWYLWTIRWFISEQQHYFSPKASVDSARGVCFC